MSKELGQKIVIKFDKEIINEDLGGYNSPNALTEYIRPTGIASASSQYSSNNPSNIMDGNISSAWQTRTTGAQWIQIDLLGDYCFTKGFRWYSSSHRPNEFIVEGSNDGSSWEGVFSGASANVSEWQEFLWPEIKRFRFYRWSITSRYSSYLYINELEILRVKGLESSFEVKGLELKHLDGELIEGEYVIEHVSRHSIEENALLLTLNPLKRFNNVEGELKVVYDATKGDLMGWGDPVESFEKSFIPIGLEAKPNPADLEKITVGLNSIVDFIKIKYSEYKGLQGNGQGQEKITVSINASINFIKADTIIT